MNIPDDLELDQEDELIGVQIVGRRADIMEVQAFYRLSGEVYDSKHEVHQQIMVDNITRDLIFSVSQKILGRKIHEETVMGHAHFFENWFQHFKATVFPEFLLRWFPAKQRTESFEQSVTWNICPHHDGEFKDGAKHIEFVTYDPIPIHYQDQSGKNNSSP